MARMFPILARGRGPLDPPRIPWVVGYAAWKVYHEHPGCGQQDCETVARRGGFSIGEMDMFLPEWRSLLCPGCGGCGAIDPSSGAACPLCGGDGLEKDK